MARQPRFEAQMKDRFEFGSDPYYFNLFMSVKPGKRMAKSAVIGCCNAALDDLDRICNDFAKNRSI